MVAEGLDQGSLAVALLPLMDAKGSRARPPPDQLRLNENLKSFD